MKTNFAKFQAEQFEKRNKVEVKPVVEDQAEEVVNEEKEESEVVEEVKETKKKSWFGKKK